MFRFTQSLVCFGLALFSIGLSISKSDAQSPKVLKGKSNDRRLQPLKDLDGYFPFDPPASRQDWEKRAAELKLQVRIALGLYPEPTRTPLNPVVHGKQDMGDYTVEKVFFESMPGYYVTASLYRPQSKSSDESKDKYPGVLCPHGHWANGRFYDAGEANAKNLVDQGGEADVEAARNHMQARCVHLARMGCVVLQYDMIGYADSGQVSYELAHRFAKQRPEFSTLSRWGFFSPRAEQNLQSIMGLQSWNSTRAVDFLLTLPEVDAERLAVTGASGGGTQSFLLAAIDDRIQVSFPAVMVSTAMQGGCTCENCCLLRVTTGNVELAGLFAPKPMGVTAANDWTKELRSKGYPELQKLYELYDASDKLMMVDRTEFGHNYNLVSRKAMYQWLNKFFNLNASVQERPFKRLLAKDLTVWDEDHPRPKNEPSFERGLLEWWTSDTSSQIEKMKNDKDVYHQFLSRAFRGLLQRSAPKAEDVEFETVFKKDAGDYWLIGGPVRNKVHGEEIAAMFVHPKDWKGEVVVLTSENGKDGLFEKDDLSPVVKKLVKAGKSVVGVDLIFQGEIGGESKLEKTRRVKNPREAAAYTFGYNHTVCAQRAHDLANLLTLVIHHERKPTRVTLAGLDQTGAIGAAALTMSDFDVSRLVLPSTAVNALDVNEIHSSYFLPGSLKYGGVKGMLTASGIEHAILDSDSLAQELLK